MHEHTAPLLATRHIGHWRNKDEDRMAVISRASYAPILMSEKTLSRHWHVTVRGIMPVITVNTNIRHVARLASRRHLLICTAIAILLAIRLHTFVTTMAMVIMSLRRRLLMPQTLLRQNKKKKMSDARLLRIVTTERCCRGGHDRRHRPMLSSLAGITLVGHAGHCLMNALATLRR